MCGIFGWDLTNSSVPKTKRAVLSAMLGIHNDERGGDSYGYVLGNRAITRGLGDIASQTADIAESPRALAHTRKATHGSISVENAHPFVIGKTIGVHNGIIWNHDELNAPRPRAEEYAVDSMHVVEAFDRSFAEPERTKELFGAIEGYGTIAALHEDEKDMMFLCRMRSGDLSIYGIGDGPEHYQGVVFSSDENDLLLALDIAGIPKFFEFEVKEGRLYYAQAGRLYHWNRNRLSRIEIAKPVAIHDWRNFRYGGGSPGEYDAEMCDSGWTTWKRPDPEEELVRGEIKAQMALEDQARNFLTDGEYQQYLDGDWEKNENGEFVKVRGDGAGLTVKVSP